MDNLSLEERIQTYVDEFENNNIIYDRLFITEQVTPQHPGKISESGKYYIYSKIYPTKEARDTELGLGQI